MFQQLLHTLTFTVARERTRDNRTTRRKPPQQLRLEPLENRQLLALIPGESLVNTSTARDQFSPAIAAAPDGRYVVVWTHQYSEFDADIHAQRFDSAGNRAGPQLYVATSSRNEHQPDVAMDSMGRFVVTWTDHVTSTNSNVMAQRFSASGERLGPVLYVARSTKNERTPSIASAANGDFVVAWTIDQGTNMDVQARMVRNDGTAITSPFLVAHSSDNEFQPDVARSHDGRFAISYQLNTDVMLRRFSATGTTIGTHRIAVSITNREVSPRIAMDNSANTIVVWQHEVGVPGSGTYDIKARRVSLTGALGSIITVRPSPKLAANEVAPSVAMKRDGSAFVVTHQNVTQRKTELTELTISGTIRRAEVVVDGLHLERAAIAFGDGSNYRVAFSRVAGNQAANIYVRRGRLS